MNEHQIRATIRRAESRLVEAETEQQRQVERDAIWRLEDMLAAPMNENILEDNFHATA
jgi:hypothetical protein